MTLTDSTVSLRQNITAVIGGTETNIGTVAATAVAAQAMTLEPRRPRAQQQSPPNESFDADLKSQQLVQ